MKITQKRLTKFFKGAFKLTFTLYYLTCVLAILLNFSIISKNMTLFLISGYPFAILGSISTSVFVADSFKKIWMILTHFSRVKWQTGVPPELKEVASKMNFKKNIKFGIRGDINTAYTIGNSIVIGSPLLLRLQTQEVQAVYAHEIEHMKKGHAIRNTLILYVPMVLIFLSVRALPTIMKNITILSAIPLFLIPLSWLAEIHADKAAAMIVGKESMISALLIISLGKNITEPSMTHPSIEKRISYLSKLP